MQSKTPTGDLSPEDRARRRQQHRDASRRYRDAGHSKKPVGPRSEQYAEQNNRRRRRLRELAAHAAVDNFPAELRAPSISIVTEDTLDDPTFIVISPRHGIRRERLREYTDR